MTEKKSIQCPECGSEIDVSDVLVAQIRGKVQARLEREQAGKWEAERTRLEQMHQQALARSLADVEQAQQAKIAAASAALEQEKRALKAAEAQIESAQKQQREAQENELKVRQEAQAIKARAEQLDLEVARKLDAERQKMQQQTREQLSQDYELKLREKEQQIQSLNQSLSDAKRRTEQGSQEIQGEALELGLEAQLRQWFPQDRIEPVPKGVRGGDLVHTVVNDGLQVCGRILWELKNTKNWQGGWIQKLKDDQRAVNAQFAVLVSVVLPPEVKRFGLVDGVWVTDVASVAGLIQAVRAQLMEIAFLKSASEGQHGKAELVYEYLVSDAFRSKVEAIVESFSAMEAQIARERRAMEKQWREREQLVRRMTTNTVGMYGEISGIVGKGLPHVKALELDDELEDDDAD